VVRTAIIPTSPGNYSYLAYDYATYRQSSFATTLEGGATFRWDVDVATTSLEMCFVQSCFFLLTNETKWGFAISNWKFDSPGNLLVFDTIFESANGQLVVSSAAANHTVLTETITTAQSTVLLKLFNFSFSDNVTQPLGIHFLISNSSVILRLVFGYFLSEVEYDPVISVLVDTPSGDGDGKTIAIAVPVAIGGALLFAFGGAVVVGLVLLVYWLGKSKIVALGGVSFDPHVEQSAL